MIQGRPVVKRVIAVNRKYHGLGNRLRVVLGAKSLADLEHREFSYHWPVGPQFGASFKDLWAFEEETVSGWRVALAQTRHPRRDATLTWLDDDARADSTWLIRTAHELQLPSGAVPWTARLRNLSPQPAIAASIQEFHSSHLAGRPYVGVMIRASAQTHALTRQHSPVEWFVEQLEELRRVQPELTFYISCDTESVSAALQQRFSDCHSLTDKGEYNSRQALTASVIDLYLLAGSGLILGPHYSSFPELAFHLAGEQIELRTSQASFGPVGGPTTLVTDPLRPHLSRSQQIR